MGFDQERKRVIVVDDESNVRESLRMLLSRLYEVDVAENAEEAVTLLSERQAASEEEDKSRFPDIMLLDVTMPGTDGMELLERVNGVYPALPVIMLTANTGVRMAVRAMKIGAVDYLNKPFDVDELFSLIEETLRTGANGKVAPSAVKVYPGRQDVAEIDGDFGGMVGDCAVMQDLYHRISQIAVRDTTVLVTGESGTGKELIAREIHRRSPRAAAPFVALNCAAIPESLIESELFGHEKGSFTHAVEKRLGHFELADGGSLLLDEIGELSLAVQVKMLRFLQEQEFYRVGRSTPIKVDVRIIAATNKNLEKEVADGRFRQDLYYRINVVMIETPPLRKRIEDVAPLVEAFFERLRPVYGGKCARILPDAMEVLKNYSWPGNVRELENVVESLLALSNKEEIGASDLPSRLRVLEPSSGDIRQDVIDGIIPFEEAEREFEKDLIMRALEKTNFVQTKAAQLLGISRRILKYKMDKLGIG